MLRRAVFFVCVALLSLPRPLRSQPTRSDPMAENFYPPDLLINHAQEIGINEQQKQAIESQVRENRHRFVQMQQNLQQQVAALAEVLRQERPDEQEAMAQLDKVLAAEREIKRVQLSLSLAIRNQLTAEQRVKAKELREKYFAETRARQPAEPIRAKMQRLQERIRQLQNDGGDPSAAVRAVQECKQLMQEGKPREAEAVLDRALAGQGSDKK